jgi:phosphate/sulfate permease
VVIVGWIYGETDDNDSKVDWSLFRTIVYAWMITVPVAAAISAFFMWIFVVANGF